MLMPIVFGVMILCGLLTLLTFLIAITEELSAGIASLVFCSICIACILMLSIGSPLQYNVVEAPVVNVGDFQVCAYKDNLFNLNLQTNKTFQEGEMVTIFEYPAQYSGIVWYQERFEIKPYGIDDD